MKKGAALTQARRDDVVWWYRQDKELSTKEIAYLTNVSLRSVQRILRGVRKPRGEGAG